MSIIKQLIEKTQSGIETFDIAAEAANVTMASGDSVETAIGSLAELSTADKSSLVNAINEVDAKAERAIPTTWAELQTIVRSGLAAQYFDIGDQFVVDKMTAATAAVGSGNTGVTAATVDADTFTAALSEIHAGDYVFTYDGNAWHYTEADTITTNAVTLSDYGITIEGTAAANDTIVITAETEQLIFDVIGIDHDTPTDTDYTHSMTLEMHDTLADYRTFDALEATVYVSPDVYPDGLAAGDYCVKQEDSSVYFNFTLTQDIPVGGQLFWNYQKVATYAAGEYSTAIEEVTAATSNDGAIGTLFTLKKDAKTETVNADTRGTSGSNNWAQSAIRQWLNSGANAGEWWTPQTNFDRPPDDATTVDGFLKGIDPAFLNVVGTVTKKTQNSIADGYGMSESEERFFLLSRPEVYGGVEREDDGSEGEPYAYYGEGRSTLTAPGTSADANRIKYKKGTTTKAYRWLRSPYSSYGFSLRRVLTSGSVPALGSAYFSSGVAPACVII